MNADAARPVQPGTSADIPRRQNEDAHLRRLLAYSWHYRVAQRWRRLRVTGTLLLAAIGPVLALAAVDTKGALAAVSAGWLVIARVLLIRFEQRARARGVNVQELFDTQLFHLPWNEALARPPLPEDVARAWRKETARRARTDKALGQLGWGLRARPGKDDPRDWYTVDLTDAVWPGDVLLCQRQSAVWSRGDHGAYTTTLITTAALWLGVGVVIALVQNLSLADYLVQLFLPTAPALVEAGEQRELHRITSDARENDVVDIDALYRDHEDDLAAIPLTKVRGVQDAAYQSRTAGPRVPGWFYRLRRNGTDADTTAGAAALRGRTTE